MKGVWTQNIDTLERIAGIKDDYIVEAHGAIFSPPPPHPPVFLFLILNRACRRFLVAKKKKKPLLRFVRFGRLLEVQKGVHEGRDQTGDHAGSSRAVSRKTLSRETRRSHCEAFPHPVVTPAFFSLFLFSLVGSAPARAVEKPFPRAAHTPFSVETQHRLLRRGSTRSLL